MKLNTIILILFLIPALGMARKDRVPKINQVILKDTSCSEMIKWVPTELQTHRAMEAIYKFLKKLPDRYHYYWSQTRTLRKNMKSYVVQFVGTEQKGKRKIWCNFLHEEYEPTGWRDCVIIVYDGGDWFWQITYDPDTEECERFLINGIA